MMIHAGTKKVEIVSLDAYRKEHFKGIGSFKYLYKNYNKQIAQNNFIKISSIPTSQNKVDTITKVEETKQEVKQEEKQEHQVAQTTENKITLDDSKLDSAGKQFFKEWKIEIA
jgi:hypothetical protein